MLPNLIPEQLNLQRMLAKLLEHQVLQMTSYSPRYAPDTQGTPQLTGRASCFRAAQGHRWLPVGPASLQRDRADEDRSKGFVEQRTAQEADTTMPQVSTMLRHTKLQFHQRQWPNPRMTAYPPFSFAKRKGPTAPLSQDLRQGYAKPDIPVLGLFFKTMTSGMKYALISKTLPLTHNSTIS